VIAYFVIFFNAMTYSGSLCPIFSQVTVGFGSALAEQLSLKERPESTLTEPEGSTVNSGMSWQGSHFTMMTDLLRATGI
jgi:hypothetical protein